MLIKKIVPTEKKIGKNSSHCNDTIQVKKKLGPDEFGVICVNCNKKYRMTREEINTDVSPCNCRALVSLSSKPTAKQKALARKLRKLDSLFKEEVGSIQDLLDNVYDTEKGISHFQKTMLKTLVELIPIAENNYRMYNNERSAYALNALVSQARELIQDIKSEVDHTGLVARLVGEVLQPAFTSLAQNVVNSMFLVKRAIEPHTGSNTAELEKLLNEITMEMTSYMQSQYDEMREKLHQNLV